MQPVANHRRRRDPASGETPRSNISREGNTSEAGPSSLSAQAASVAVDGSSPSTEDPVCPVCAVPSAIYAVGDCGHAICAACSHRLRLLYRRFTCVICNTHNDYVVVAPASDYVAGKTTASSLRQRYCAEHKQLSQDVATNMIFVDNGVKRRLHLIAGFTCPVHVRGLTENDINKYLLNTGQTADKSSATSSVARDKSRDVEDDCPAPFHRNIMALRGHVKEQHRSVFCGVCIASRAEYKSMLPVYPLDSYGRGKKSARLNEHMKTTHPPCRFCNISFFDDDQLYNHLVKAHESCNVCERAGRMHEYFRNFAALEEHYRRNHFVCEDPGCRGIVFASKFDLQAHTVQRHRSDLPKNARSRRLQVDLSELHAPSGGTPARGGRNAGSSHIFFSEEDERAEQERQAARRRGFLASRVVFLHDNAGGSMSGAGPSGLTSHSQDSYEASTVGPASTGELQNVALEDARNNGDVLANGASDAAVSQDTLGSESNPVGDSGFHERALPSNSSEGASRNRKLIEFLRSNLDPAEFEQFKVSSGDFQAGKLSAERYHDVAVEAFGTRRAVRDVLPELVALLPNADLRKKLVQVCVARDPPSSSSNAAVPPYSDTSRNSFQQRLQLQPSSRFTAESLEEAFPSLPGQRHVVPLAAASSSKNARNSRKTEDFPKLSDVHAPRRAAETGRDLSSTLTTWDRNRNSSRQSSATEVLNSSRTDRIFGTRVRHQGESTRQQRSRSRSRSQSQSHPPTPAAVMRGDGNARREESSTGGLVGTVSDSDAFPSLQMSSLQIGDEIDSSATHDNSQALDPALRVGAVWGGYSGLAHASRRTKLGPGRAAQSSRHEHSIARSVTETGTVGNSADERSSEGASELFPVPTHSGDDKYSNDPIQRSKGGSDSSRVKPAVLDIPSMAQNRPSRSALPKVGGSGFGFAWERKKMRAKQREVKAEAKSSTSDVPATGRNDDTVCLKPGREVIQVIAKRTESTASDSAISVERVGDHEAATADVDVSREDEDSSFANGHDDPIPSLKVEDDSTEGSDPTALFFGYG